MTQAGCLGVHSLICYFIYVQKALAKLSYLLCVLPSTRFCAGSTFIAELRRAGKRMTDEFLVGEIATLFMAGFETTGASSLLFCAVRALLISRPAH